MFVYCNEDTTWSHLTQAQSLLIISSKVFLFIFFFFCFLLFFVCFLIRTSLDWVRFHKIIHISYTKCVYNLHLLLLRNKIFVNFWNLFIHFSVKCFCMVKRLQRMQCVFQFSFAFAFNKRLRVSRFLSECIVCFWFDQCVMSIQKCCTEHQTCSQPYKIGEFSRNFHLKCRAISTTIHTL